MYTLITGTTNGIGKEFAELFAKKGYNLVTVAMNEEKLKEQKQTLESKYNISVKYIVKDLSIEESYSEIYNEVKASNIEIDILINNAGFATYGNYIDVEWQKQKNLAMVNMMAVMQLSYMFGKDMAKRKSGRIMNIASIASFEPGPFMTMYYASKAFVRSFSEGLHEELKDQGVIVTAICPGPTKTKFEERASMKKSYMFKKMKVDTAKDVAEKSYKAMMKNKAVYVVGFHNKLIAFATRFGSLKLNRKVAKKINIGTAK